MRSAAARVAEIGADLIDLNMGCPVPKVMKTGAGAALMKDPDTAVAVARAAAEGSGLPGHREAARRGDRRRAPAGRGGRRRRHHLPPAHGQGPPQGPPRLRAGRPGRAGPPGAGDRLRRDARGRPHPLGVRVHGRRGDHARARLAREPVAVRGAARRPRRGARAATRSSTSGCGCSTAPRSTSAPTARPATCASSTPGTSSVSATPARSSGRPPAGRHAGRAAGADRRPANRGFRRVGRCYHAALRRTRPGAPPVRSVQRAFSFSGPDLGRRAMQKDVLLTPEGLDKLKAEIEYLSNDKRREVAERIKEAREFGDISENSEYDDAKNEQAMLEARIASLEDKLRSASVIDASELSSDVVRVGSQVSVKDEGSGKSLQYTIVGSTEANPLREPALQRVSGRQGAAGPQEGRLRQGDAPQRQEARAEDHEDRRRVSELAFGRRSRDPRRKTAQAGGGPRRGRGPVSARVRRRRPDRRGARGSRRPGARR